MNASALGLQVQGLRVAYGDFVAVADASFRVDPGASCGIVGESGSGKSTVLRAICGLAPMQTGQVQLLGTDARALAAPGSKAFKRQVQMVFQDPYGSLHPRQTVDRILAEPLDIHHLDRPQARIEEALDQVGLGSAYRFRYPHQLSGGQRQRVALARALILQPQVLLLDEPMAGMGPDETLRLTELIESLRGRAAMLLVEHDMQAVFRLADRISVLVYGRIIATGTPEEIRANDAVRQAYLGDEGAQ